MNRCHLRRCAMLLSAAAVVSLTSIRIPAIEPIEAMRDAMGGAAVFDTLTSWSATGTRTSKGPGFSKSMSLEQLAQLPDRFLEIKRDRDIGGPLDIDITYYNGFAGDVLIKRVDSTIPFPPDPGPNTPAAIAQRERAAWQGAQTTFRRLMLLLTGRSPLGSPMTATVVAPETIYGQPTIVIEVKSADEFAVRLHINSETNLPAGISWQAPAPVTFTTSSTAIVSRGAVQSQSPALVPNLPPPGAPVTWFMTVSDFKNRDGALWPHRFQIRAGGQVTEETRISRYRLNPKIDARRFEGRR